jgi:hypothetical protein
MVAGDSRVGIAKSVLTGMPEGRLALVIAVMAPILAWVGIISRWQIQLQGETGRKNIA